MRPKILYRDSSKPGTKYMYITFSVQLHLGTVIGQLAQNVDSF